MDPLTYKKSGVDIDKASRILGSFSKFLKSRPRDPNVISGIGGFASCYDLGPALSSLKNPSLVTCCDGAGTKPKLALQWNYLEGLGNDLVAMNINDLLCCGAMPLLFLDYYACGTLQEEMSLTLLKSIQRACEIAECTLIGGETAEMPSVYANGEFDLAGFAIGLVDKNRTLGSHNVKRGDKLLALASSGPHSNGYSLLRKLIEQENLNPDDSPPFGPGTWREILLSPTTIYVPALKDVLPSLHALSHITGGGLYENLPRVLPPGCQAIVYEDKWGIPPLFSWIQERANLSLKELLCTLNCGVGMIAVCGAEEAKEIAKNINQKEQKCWEIGHVEFEPSSVPAKVIWK